VNIDPWTSGAALLAALLLIPRLLGGRRAAPEVVRQKIAAGAKVVDVRSPGEFRSGSYPGAINIPLQELRARLKALPKESAVVVFCASGVRSASAARLLAKAGYTDVLNAGGLRHMPR
jgi:phage shock protein E